MSPSTCPNGAGVGVGDVEVVVTLEFGDAVTGAGREVVGATAVLAGALAVVSDGVGTGGSAVTLQAAANSVKLSMEIISRMA